MTIYTSRYGAADVPEVSITDLVFAGLALSADRIVLKCEVTGHSLTGTVLADRIRRLAGGLTARGIGQGSVVAIMSGNTPEFATVFHGVAYAGATLTTVNPSYTQPELHHQLVDSGASVLIVPSTLLELGKAAATGTQVTLIATIDAVEGTPNLEDLMGEAAQSQAPVDLHKDTVVLPYSSGTTGLPKGVRLSHRNLVANVIQVQTCIELKSGDVTLAILPFFHIYGMQVLMNLYLSMGAGLVTLPRFDLALALGVLARERIEKLFVAPPVVLALAKHPLVAEHDLSALRFVLSGAAPLGGDLAQACAARLGAEVTQGYGMTEASPVTHFNGPGTNKVGHVGPLVQGTEARLIDPATGTDAEIGQEGELWVRGPQIMLGYHNNPEATASSLSSDGWLRTGDLARAGEDGSFAIMDRLKELIKVSGFQVAPAEVEAVLLTHPDIADAAVTAIPDDEAGERPKAHIVAKAGAVLTVQSVHDHLAGQLASYKRPREIVFVDSIPKSASGKILRRLLKA